MTRTLCLEETSLFVSLDGGSCHTCVLGTNLCSECVFVACLDEHFPHVPHDNPVRRAGRMWIIYSFVHKEIGFGGNVISPRLPGTLSLLKRDERGPTDRGKRFKILHCD